jgi:hypothetical protein
MLKTLINSHSQERFTDYYKIAKSPIDTNILKLYFLNQKISCYFYFIIQNLEVSLRNKINLIISNKNNPHWLQTPSSSIIIDAYQQEKILKELHKITHLNYSANNIHNLLISRLNLGFWISILQNNPNLIKDTFNLTLTPKNSKSLTTSFIVSLNKIKFLRNRISHTENIIKKLKDIINYENETKRVFVSLSKDIYFLVLKELENHLQTNFIKILKEISELHTDNTK